MYVPAAVLAEDVPQRRRVCIRMKQLIQYKCDSGIVLDSSLN